MEPQQITASEDTELYKQHIAVRRGTTWWQGVDQAGSEQVPQVRLGHMMHVGPSFVRNVLLLDPGCCLRAHTVLIVLIGTVEPVEPEEKKSRRVKMCAACYADRVTNTTHVTVYRSPYGTGLGMGGGW